MTPMEPKTPREQLETQITAMLLGELSPEEALRVKQAVDSDPELSELRDRLKTAIELVNKTLHQRTEQTGQLSANRLSEKRRQQLLAHFKLTPAITPNPARKWRVPWFIPMAAAALLIGLVVITNFLTAIGGRSSHSLYFSPLAEKLSGLSGENHDYDATLSIQPKNGENFYFVPQTTADGKKESAPAKVPTQPGSDNGIYLPAGAAESRSVADLEKQTAATGLTVTSGPQRRTAEEKLNKNAEFRESDEIAQQLSERGAAVAGVQIGKDTLKRESLERLDANAMPAGEIAGSGGGQGGGYGGYGGGGRSVEAYKKLRSDLNDEQLEQAKASVDSRDRKSDVAETDSRVTNEPANGREFLWGVTTGLGFVRAEKPAEPAPGPGTRPQSTLQTPGLQSANALQPAAPPPPPPASVTPVELALGDKPAHVRTEYSGVIESKSKIHHDLSGSNAEENRLKDAKAVPSLARDLAAATAAAPTPAAKPTPPIAALVPQPEVFTRDNPFSTFSLNVSDVSFKLAAASLQQGQLPSRTSIRVEEFINAFNYRDPEPQPQAAVAFAWDRARYPFAHNRDLIRFSIKTAAQGRQQNRPLNIVLLLDNSGSMERADRVQIIREALRILPQQLQPNDKISVVLFARTAQLWIDGLPARLAGNLAERASRLTPQGGTNLEDALALAYKTALRHYLRNGINRVVLLTDGAANLGNVDPAQLQQTVEKHRQQGIALDCFGIGWEGYNDDLLEQLSRHGDGRYGFVNSPDEAATELAGQLAGAFKVAASDVKVQVEFNPQRVNVWRQLGYARHQLTKEQFRDNTVDAAELGAAEAGNALYLVEINAAGQGPLGTVRVRFKEPATGLVREQDWVVPYHGTSVPLEQASPAMRLAAVAGAFGEWLSGSPYAVEVTPDRLLGYLSGVPSIYGADPRPQQLEAMIRQAKSLAGR